MEINSIETEQLEKLFNLVIQKLRKDNLKHVDFDTQEYWLISTDEWNNFNESPAPLVGSLTDDLLYLKRSIEESEIITYSDFDRIASVLRAISEKQAPSK